MTFSRPNIGMIDVGGRIRNPQDQRGAPGVDVPGVRSAPRISSADQDARRIMSEAERDNERIGRLLGGLSEVGVGALSAIGKTKDREQWRNILADPATADQLQKTTDPATRRFIATLRPDVQKMAGEAVAKVAVAKYEKHYLSSSLLTPGVMGPLVNEKGVVETKEEWQTNQPARLAELRKKARDISGLSNVAPEHLPSVIDQIVKAEGVVSATAISNRTEVEYKNLLSNYNDNNRVELSGVLEKIRVISKDPKIDSAEGGKQQMQLLTEYMGRASGYGKSLGLTDIQIQGSIGAAFAGYITELLDPNTDLTSTERLNAINDIRTILSDDIAGKGALAAAKLPGLGQMVIDDKGTTLRMLVQPVIDRARRQVKEDKEDPSMLLLIDALVAIKNSDTAGAMAIANKMVADSGKTYDPKITAQVVQLVSQTQNKPTPNQESAYDSAMATLELLPGAEARIAYINQIGARLTDAQRASLLARYKNQTQAEEQDKLGTPQALISMGIASNIIANERQVFMDNLSGKYGLDKYGVTQETNQMQRDLQRRGLEWFNSYVAAKGAKPSRAEIEQKLLELEKQNQDSVARRYGQSGGKARPVAYQDRVGRQFSQFLERIRSGRTGMDRFDRTTLQEFGKTNPGVQPKYEAVERWLIESAGKLTGTKNGKQERIYPDPHLEVRKAAEERTKRLRDKLPKGPGFVGSAGGSDDQMPVAFVENAYNALASLLPAAPAAARPEQPQARPAAPVPQLSPAQDARGRLALRIARVPERLIQGMQSVSGFVRNIENEPALAKLFRGERLQPNTPPLPQAAFNVPAPISYRITPNHPFMIAIGIGEGTRTADGGKTDMWTRHVDPADGAINVGTISYSASRNRGLKMSPAAADAYYARQLQREMLRITPVLESLGLARGTVGFNRVAYNALDLMIQLPAAYSGAGGFLEKLPQIVRQGATIEAIARARTESFRDPRTGRLQAAAVYGNSPTERYNGLLLDQRKRAMAFDYMRRFN